MWTALYIMVGVAGWLVWRRQGASPPLRLWGWQLAANALWAPAFFDLHSPAIALGVMAVLLALVALCVRAFRRVSRSAGALVAVYGVWCGYAAYLNVGFLLLNNS